MIHSDYTVFCWFFFLHWSYITVVIHCEHSLSLRMRYFYMPAQRMTLHPQQREELESVSVHL